jgi:serine/threonine protein kinase
MRKDVFPDEAQWKDPALWDDVMKTNSKIPNELETHSRLTRAGVGGIVQLREDHHNDPSIIHRAHKTYRVYTEYAQHGDLENFLEDYVREGDDVPEPFIWCVAEHLVEAGLGMFQGGTIPLPDWQQIVHRDYKLRNVFLSTRSLMRYTEYPGLLLGDFGLAFFTSVDDENNPDFYLGVTTERWTAPEQSLD